MTKVRITVSVEGTTGIALQALMDLAKVVMDEAYPAAVEFLDEVTDEGTEIELQPLCKVRQADEWFATPGCNCPQCQLLRSEATAHLN